MSSAVDRPDEVAENGDDQIITGRCMSAPGLWQESPLHIKVISDIYTIRILEQRFCALRHLQDILVTELGCRTVERRDSILTTSITVHASINYEFPTDISLGTNPSECPP